MLLNLTAVELKLFFREKVGPGLIFALPLALLFGFGLMPDAQKADKDLGGQTGAQYIAGIGVGLILVCLGLTILPSVLADYREKGVLRRLGTTPVRPVLLLAAQMIIYVCSAIVAITVLVVVGRIALGTPMPGKPAWFVLAVLLGMGALFGIGLVISAVAPSGKAGTGLGMLLFFPSMFLGGVYIPREQMPSVLRAIGDYTPLGATIKTVRDAWLGTDPRPAQLAIMAGYTLVFGVVAAKFFSWE